MQNHNHSATMNQSIFVKSLSPKRKIENDESLTEPELNDSKDSKKQKINSDSDTISVNSFDCDDLIVYSPESFNGDFAEESQDKLLDKETFLQIDNCYRTSLEIPQCRECRQNPDCNKYNCRFYLFRKIERDNGSFRVVAYMDKFFDISLADLEIWTKGDPALLKDLDTASKLHILRCTASQFCELASEEAGVLESYCADKSNEKTVAWKRYLYKVREMCDVCSTSIFNYHHVCITCGTIVCIDCYKERKEGIVTWKMTKSERDERDKFFWLKCTNDEQHKMILSQMIPGDSLANLNKVLHSFCDVQNIKMFCACRDKAQIPSDSKEKLQFQRILASTRRKRLRINIVWPRNLFEHNMQFIQYSWVAGQSVLKFESPTESAEGYNVFQGEWSRGKPVVVADVKRTLKENIWSPDFFMEKFGDIKHSLVNCQNDTAIKQVPMKHFWIGFKSFAARLPLENKNKLILKLKDWPTTGDFAEILEEHYNDVMKSIPFPAYTRRDGKFNLAKYQHLHFLKPDLGPKMYCAYGNFDQTMSPKKGSTNLHLDISDACNILVHVSRPEDHKLAKKQYDKLEIKKALEAAGCDEEDLQNFMTSEKLPGAIWNIYHATDVKKIRKAIHEYARDNNIPLKSYEDPLHNQDWYIDEKLRKTLEAKGIKSYTIIQYDGDCVFIPAGAPHQVTNILDCIKVALDFVSPENITECFNLTNEFRQLSSRHVNREDKLQIKSILYHTCKCLVPSPKNESE